MTADLALQTTKSARSYPVPCRLLMEKLPHKWLQYRPRLGTVSAPALDLGNALAWTAHTCQGRLICCWTALHPSQRAAPRGTVITRLCAIHLESMLYKW